MMISWHLCLKRQFPNVRVRGQSAVSQEADKRGQGKAASMWSIEGRMRRGDLLMQGHNYSEPYKWELRIRLVNAGKLDQPWGETLGAEEVNSLADEARLKAESPDRSTTWQTSQAGVRSYQARRSHGELLPLISVA